MPRKKKTETESKTAEPKADAKELELLVYRLRKRLTRMEERNAKIEAAITSLAGPGALR